MNKKKDQTKAAMILILESYNTFFEKIFSNQLFSTQDQKILQKIYQKLQEISALIGNLESWGRKSWTILSLEFLN